MELKFIKEHKTKTITIDEIKNHVKYTTQKELYDIVQEYIEKNILIPFGKGTTYERPYLHKKYKIVPEDNSEILKEMEELKLLNMNHYKKNIQEFINHKSYLIAMNKYFTTSLSSDVTLSLNERSLKIFKDEKFLASKTGGKVIANVGRTLDDFNIYRTPEIFMYYRHNTSSGNVLIVENKDTWTTFKKHLIKHNNILGKEFDAIIFGEGKKILSSFQFISESEFESFNSKGNTFYYFGDIDSSGISIMYRFMESYKQYNIVPFMEGYDILFENMDTYGHKKYHEDKTEKEDINITKEKIAKCFPHIDVDAIYDFCKESKIIPQEVVNNEILIRGGNNGR